MDMAQKRSIFKGNKNHGPAANYPVEKINDHIRDLKVKKGLIQRDYFYDRILKHGKSQVLRMDNDEDSRPKPFEKLFQKIAEDKEYQQRNAKKDREKKRAAVVEKSLLESSKKPSAANSPAVLSPAASQRGLVVKGSLSPRADLTIENTIDQTPGGLI